MLPLRRAAACLLALAVLSPAAGQEYGARLGTVKRGGAVSFEPTGPGVLFDALDPVVRKWYVPHELWAEYGWQQWRYSNYARQPYQRYVSTAIEGLYYYDAFGNFLTQGWLIYDWREESPQPFGSALYKDPRFRSWFNQLVVAADHRGQHHYAITVGSEIRTTLTPMTFSKPKFNGLQLDFSSDKYDGTLVLSRISGPDQEVTGLSRTGDQRTDATNLMGSRLVVQVGDFVRVGGTFLSAFQSNTQTGTSGSDFVHGQLSGPQNAASVTLVEVRIGDDSPEDGEGGGALFASDVLVEDLEGNRVRGSEIGFRAQIEGGLERQGFLSADGHETILLRYDLQDRTYAGPDPSRIARITVELVIANDYRVEVTSDQQDGVFLPVARASGNVKDSSNQRVLSFAYGLPTAAQVAGLTVEVDDLAGFRAYAEYDNSRQFRQYPNPSTEQHHTATGGADAWVLNLSRTRYPFFFYGEAFSVAPAYGTSMPLIDREGEPHYGDPFWRYEFVEDNDDQDQFPDWFRRWSGEPDREVFPGWDENNDFVSDFNQNDNEASPNLVPDYEEPFLRFHTDRPEYLYGVDMNHNGTVDRFENDEEPDYPYAADQRGLNAYGGAFLDPDTRLHLGHQRVRQPSDDRRNRATYLLLTADKSHARIGRVRLFQDVRRVRDDIADDLFQWVQEANTRGSQRLVRDPLPAQDTWINTSWLGLDWRGASGLYLGHRTRWQLMRQRGSDDEVELRQVRRSSSLLGLVDKAEYRVSLGNLTLLPRWKSELRWETPVERLRPRRREVEEVLMLLVRRPLLRHSLVELGVEQGWFTQLREPTPPGAADSHRSTVLAAQLTNQSDYQGYRLTTVLGCAVDRRQSEGARALTRTRGFVTVYAGVEQ
ncbi:MAG: hypothetical protein AB1505_16835 [Candidatus Latescibacterota bacterium]